MQIAVQYSSNNSNFEMVMHADDGGQLVCSHEHIEHDPGETGTDWSEPSWSQFDYCADCGRVLDDEEVWLSPRVADGKTNKASRLMNYRLPTRGS